MDIRYIYMHRETAVFGHSQWMRASEPDNVKARALSHVSNIAKRSVLVVERDPDSGFMVPLGFDGAL